MRTSESCDTASWLLLGSRSCQSRNCESWSNVDFSSASASMAPVEAPTPNGRLWRITFSSRLRPKRLNGQAQVGLDNAIAARRLQAAAKLDRLIAGAERANHRAVVRALPCEVGTPDHRLTVTEHARILGFDAAECGLGVGLAALGRNLHEIAAVARGRRGHACWCGGACARWRQRGIFGRERQRRVGPRRSRRRRTNRRWRWRGTRGRGASLLRRRCRIGEIERRVGWRGRTAACRIGAAGAGCVTIGGRATDVSGASGRIVTVRTFLGSVSTLDGVPPFAAVAGAG